ncbi:MAG: DUF4956 domain-containing protein [Rhodospirillaceae bacterium]|jgi:hypothetical protein|nr:DUF4956 domain-containing protein [Rhodospirillaceae bacterium]MBT5194144.1 DUF4956 domain-containing protein [Rhodospirillaceae bacterium]
MDAALESLLPQTLSISIVDLVLAILSSFLINLGIAFVYRYTHRGLNYERSFLTTLILTGPVIALVIMLIGSNIALSLGLVGALSIIRFRNVIKDSRDMSFLFWVIAVGLGAGTFNFKVILIASILIGAIIFLLYFLSYGKTRHEDCVIVIRGPEKQSMDTIEEVIAPYTEDTQMRSYEIEDGRWELVMELRLSSDEFTGQEAMLDQLNGLDNVEHVSIMRPAMSLPL